MKIALINPNTTASMTDKAAREARKVAAKDTEILAFQPDMGPESIEGVYDGALAVPGLLSVLQQQRDNADGFVIACFDDTGLDAARSLVHQPVVGIGEAAYHVATLVAYRFAVVTTLSRSIPILEQNIARYGLASRCCAVRASDVPVLALEHEDAQALEKVHTEVKAAIKENHADAIVLGCAGMTNLAKSLQDQYSLPVIDGVVSAVKLVETCVSLGLETSSIGPWAPPLAKAYHGILSAYRPE